MGYCFMSTEKIHSLGELTAKHNHNYRKVFVDNANPFEKDKNEELLPLPINANGQQMDYNDFFKKRMREIGNPKTRKNAVYAIEVVTTFSKEDNIDIETWKKRNVEWLQKEFNKAGDGKNNIASVVYHGDEAGNVHCHAIVIPVNSQNKLCASSYLDGSRALSDMQTSYAKDMEEFGLERGLERGQMKHKDIKKFYADLNRSITVPLPEPQETSMEYHDRVMQQIQELQASLKRKRMKEEAEMRRRIAEEKLLAKKAIENEMRSKKIELERELKGTATVLWNTKKELQGLQTQLQDLCKKYGISMEELEEKIQFADAFSSKYKQLQYADPETYQTLQEIITKMNHLESTMEKGR